MKFLQKQTEMSLPGLAKDIKEIIKELNLPDITDKNINTKWSKQRWKNKIKEEIIKKCEKELRERIQNIEKLKKCGILRQKTT